MNKEALRDISYGMYIITSQRNEEKVGCVVNTVTQLTSENVLISVCINKENYTNQIIKQTKKFAINILNEKTDPNLIRTFGFQSSKEIDKFADCEYEEINDLPVISNQCNGYILCEVINVVDAETHDLFLARVIDMKKVSKENPMTYKYYHEVIKGRAPKKAPTYEEENPSEEETWVCDVCGYVHKGPLPKGFICPICGMDESHFQKKRKKKDRSSSKIEKNA